MFEFRHVSSIHVLAIDFRRGRATRAHSTLNSSIISYRQTNVKKIMHASLFNSRPNVVRDRSNYMMIWFWLPFHNAQCISVISVFFCDARSSIAAWHFAVVPGRRLPSCRRCSWATTTFHSEPNMRFDADIQHLRQQSICSCWARAMEQSSIAPERGGLIVR